MANDKIIESSPSSNSGGVKVFPIEGPMKDERYRLQGMTPEERAWRIQWLKDQVLSPNEPKPIPGFYQERFNPIRRFYRWPLETLFRPLIPTLGYDRACAYRWMTGKVIIVTFLLYSGFYYFKYNAGDWTRMGGLRIRYNKPKVFPGEPGYPFAEERQPNEYFTEGFDKSPI